MERESSTSRISYWDSKSNPLAPLAEKQRASIIELNTYNKKPVPKKVHLCVHSSCRWLLPVTIFFS